MSFHLGKPILVMLIVATIAGAVIAFRPAPRTADLTMWVFADSHYTAYAARPDGAPSLIDQFEQENHLTVNLSLINNNAELLRLNSLFMSDPTSRQLPDIAEVEIGWVGTFFRPPVDEVGFTPLNDILKKTGWYDKILQQRFAPWSKQGVIFGIPHDVHPCTITYRHDLFWGVERKDGSIDGPRIDLTQAKTWPQFHAMCEQFEHYWQSRGYRYRHAIELPSNTADYANVMLLQRGINLVDDYGVVHLDNPKVANTLAFYAQLIAGKRNIAGQTSGGTGALTKDIVEGNLCSFITPDWRVTYIKKYSTPADDPARSVAGKMRMIPLPIFDPGDVPTSTWGGTMIGIPKACRNKEAAWKLIEKLFFSREGLEARSKQTDILPPVKTFWDLPQYHQPDPYFGGQKSAEMFIELARQIPKRYVTPATALASAELTFVLNRAINHLEEHGPDDLEPQCQKWLTEAARSLKARIKQYSLED